MIFKNKKYNIFKQRYMIVFFAIFFSILTSLIFGKEFYDFFINYILSVVIFDQISRLFNPVSLSEKIVFKAFKITKKQLEKYVNSKRVYRLIAFSVALLIGSITKVWVYEFSTYFIATYALLWKFYPLIRKFYLKIPAPKFFKYINACTKDEYEKFSTQNSSTASTDRWPPQQSYAMNLITPGTNEWISHRNRWQ